MRDYDTVLSALAAANPVPHDLAAFLATGYEVEYGSAGAVLITSSPLTGANPKVVLLGGDPLVEPPRRRRRVAHRRLVVGIALLTGIAIATVALAATGVYPFAGSSAPHGPSIGPLPIGGPNTTSSAVPQTADPAVDAASAVLSLADVPRGYGDGDSGCGAVSWGGESNFPSLNPLFRKTRPFRCTTELKRVWHDASIGPFWIRSTAFVVADEDAAQRLYAVRLALARMAGDLRSAKSTPIELGDEAVLLEGEGMSGPAAAIVWRSGNVVAVLGTEPADLARTRSLAEAQQALIEQPPPPQAPNEEAALALDDPSIRLPVYWLGDTFTPGDGLPRLTLSSSEHNAPDDGPGNTVRMYYGPDAPRVDGVKLSLWEPAAWERFSDTQLGRVIWDTPCLTKTTIELANGHAEIVAGYATPAILREPCPTTPPDRMMARVHLPGVVVTIDMPNCFTCRQPTRWAHPYDTPAAMEAVVRALELRPPKR